jgi:hypothetical protein
LIGGRGGRKKGKRAGFQVWVFFKLSLSFFACLFSLPRERTLRSWLSLRSEREREIVEK